MYEYSVHWADLVDIHLSPVIEDADAGATLAKYFAK
jgi:hypothetical protein